MIKLTRIQWPVWNWVNILIYFFISVSVQAENSFVVVEKSPAVRPGVDHHPITNCEIFIQPFAQPLCLIETLQIVSNTSRLFIYIASFFRISDPLNTISSQFVEQNTNHRLRLTQVHVKNASTNLLVLFSCILTVAKNGYFILQGGLIYPKCVSVLTV